MGTCLLSLLGASSCAERAVPAAQAAPEFEAGCLVAGDGTLQAALRGAVVADLAWRNEQMLCDGGMRPDGKGLRLTIAGPLPAAGSAQPRTVRFIFGIDAAGAQEKAQAMPTNLTIIVEGADEIYATRGDSWCAVDSLQRDAIPGSGAPLERITARGYCTAPASSLRGDAEVLVPTFAFTTLLKDAER